MEEIKDEKMREEIRKREIEERAKLFLKEYRFLCRKFGMELTVEKPSFAIIDKKTDDENH